MTWRDNVRFVVQRVRRKPLPCDHVATIQPVDTPSRLCRACLELGDEWVHLRQCMTCGTVGCCDSSKNRHAHRHADEHGHPIARSAQPDENWMWCFVDSRLVGR